MQANISTNPVANELTLTIHDVNWEWRSRCAVWKRGGHRRWAQENIPLSEAVLPGENGLVASMQRCQVVGEGSRWFILFRLECSNHHAN